MPRLPHKYPPVSATIVTIWPTVTQEVIMSNTLQASSVTADQSRSTQATTRAETKKFRSLQARRLLAIIKRPAPCGEEATTIENSNANSVSKVNRKQVSSRSIFRRSHVPQSTHDVMDASALMGWLQTDCPQDLVPRVLAYAGPQMTAALSKTCRFWKEMTDKESTWKTLCEELYKWKQGHAVPESWRDFYKFRPCVPVDFSTVDRAFSLLRNLRVGGEQMPQSIRVLLRPGRYVLREAITVQAPQSVRVEMETMEVPDLYCLVDQTSSAAVLESEPPTRRISKSLQWRSILFSCRTTDAVELEDEFFNGVECFEPPLLISSNGNKRALVFLHTRQHNEPIIRVREGITVLRNLELKHASLGLDVFNGNAAVHIQPQTGTDDKQNMVAPVPTVIMEGVDVTSASGRGIVNIDGGQVTIRNCYVHDCASTGIYVGGSGSRAQVERTDVVRNGRGNTTPHRGVAKGHSGVYLEQGRLSVVDCNISQNTTTGISVLSPENAMLNLEQSDLVSNGNFPLQLPSIGTLSHANCNSINNIMAPVGVPRSRSDLASDGVSLGSVER